MYEIELKSVLTKEKFNSLSKELSKKLKLSKEETVHTIKFNPSNNGDIRLRYSDNDYKLLYKIGNATDISRKEIELQLHSKEDIKKFQTIFTHLGMKQEPSWIKHKREFEYPFNGYNYVISLQYIENFAHILEVEYMTHANEMVHQDNIREIFKELDCEPIEPKDFLNRINEYIKNNKE